MLTPENPAVRKGWLALQQARNYIKQKHPYFFATTLGLIPVHVPHIQTMFVTNKMVLGIDMEWFGTEETDVGAGCLLHENMHVLRDMSRMDAFEDKEVAGYAFDAPINDDLKNFDIKLPPWVVYTDTLGLPKGLTGEKYYEILMERKRKNKQLFPPGTILRIGAGKCGSCDGLTMDTNVPSDEPGRSSADVRYFRNSGINEIREYCKGKPGRTPGTLKELLEQTGREEPVVPWQQVTQSSLGRAIGRIKYGHADYSIRRPAKRSYALGYPRPGLIANEPSVCFIEDTSGSMDHKQLFGNRVEMANLLRQKGLTQAWFFAADHAVQTEPRLVSIQELMTFPVVGRGGTDFRPAIAKAMKIRPAPNLIIYSTDGAGAAPERKPPGVEFIWLLCPGRWTMRPCNWGMQILTSNDPEVRQKYQVLQ